ncbi:DHHW family protein [Ruminococcus flavefaciens]|uniref:DHHW family protein n=1 Tax=Ruminococcus flavefaciens TaxID=1265 RepID=UPI00048B8816|nr:DHHW family protein [Ruminococcus flavefaciens]
MNRIISKITALLTIVFIAIFSVCTFFGKKKDYSVDENRPLAAAPTIKAGEFYDGRTAEKLDRCMTDHFAGRSSWLVGSTLIQKELSESIVNGVYVSEERLINAEQSSDAEPVASADIFENFAENYDGMVYFAAIPTSAGVYGDVLPSHITGPSESQQISELYEALDGDIRKIDAYNILKMLKDNYIYYRSDTKWTSYGAYCVYKTVIQKLGIIPTAYDKFSIEHVTDNFRGDLYNRTMSKAPRADIMDVFEYREGAEVTSCIVVRRDGINAEGKIFDKSRLETGDMYSMYLGEPVPVMRITTSANTDKKLLVIKDSFADCFVPFLLQHYSEITVLDPSVMSGGMSAYVDPNEYEQTLFLFGIDSLGDRKMLSKIIE